MRLISRSNIWPILCTLLVLLSSHGALAQTKNNPELKLAASVLHFGYQEFDDNGVLLDREDGYLPGFNLGLSKTSDHWVFAGDFAYHGGNVLYTGQTQAGIPMSTRTIQNIADIAVRTEYWPASGKNYAFYFGAGYHHWDRDIRPGNDVNGNPVGGLFETYRWWSAFIGAKKILYQSGSDRWLLDARLLQSIKPTINVTFGQNDNSTMELGEHLGGRLSLYWNHAFNRSLNLNIEPYIERLDLGRSANTPLTKNGIAVIDVNTGLQQYIYEPRSQTTIYGLTVGISHYF